MVQTNLLGPLMGLKYPQVQVVVMSANMGCSHCRQRVANVVSKMNGEHKIKSTQIVVYSVRLFLPKQLRTS
jgi:copper chaperone CopZ